jgi:hypothetical protein
MYIPGASSDPTEHKIFWADGLSLGPWGHCQRAADYLAIHYLVRLLQDSTHFFICLLFSFEALIYLFFQDSYHSRSLPVEVLTACGDQMPLYTILPSPLLHPAEVRLLHLLRSCHQLVPPVRLDSCWFAPHTHKPSHAMRKLSVEYMSMNSTCIAEAAVQTNMTPNPFRLAFCSLFCGTLLGQTSPPPQTGIWSMAPLCGQVGGPSFTPCIFFP